VSEGGRESEGPEARRWTGGGGTREDASDGGGRGRREGGEGASEAGREGEGVSRGRELGRAGEGGKEGGKRPGEGHRPGGRKLESNTLYFAFISTSSMNFSVLLLTVTLLLARPGHLPKT
jgi:hypothetical protein